MFTHRFLLFLLIASKASLLADVASTKSQIDFDVGRDNQVEMTLNDVGLGLGKTASEKLDVNGNAQISHKVYIGGTLELGFQTITSDTTLSENTLVLLDTTSDNIMVTLPPANSSQGRIYKVKRTSFENQCYITASENIDGYRRLELTNHNLDLAYVELLSNGTQWLSLNKSQHVVSVESSDNLVAWWKLDETSGSTVVFDSSGNEYHGVYSNIDSSDIGVVGRFNRGTSVTEADDQILIDSNSNLELQEFTYSFWINFETVDAQEVILTYKTDLLGSLGAILMRKETTNFLTAFLYDGTDYEPRVTSAGAVSADTWYHVALTYDQNNLSLYLNGEVASTARNFSVAYATTNNLVIGNNGTPDRPADAIIDDFRIYNYALSEEEVTRFQIQQ